jgi:excinuclease ABC subunit A
MADHVIDIGPEGGIGGGKLVFEGTPEAMAKSGKGFTAPYLKTELDTK